MLRSAGADRGSVGARRAGACRRWSGDWLLPAGTVWGARSTAAGPKGRARRTAAAAA